MASSSGRGKGQKKDHNEIITEDEVFTAVVIADSYDSSLHPHTLSHPRVLTPLANVPLIDYTLGFLNLSGVDQVIVYCSSHAEVVRDYVKSRWDGVFESLLVIINEEAQCIGDALRDLDTKQLISADFVLTYGDVIANIDLQACLRNHQKTRETDRDAILTQLMKQCPPNHRSCQPELMSLYAVNKSTKQILHHQRVGSRTRVKIPIELIRKQKDLQLRHDLVECHVTMCAPSVPSIFTDNFDYQTMEDLVHGVLGNQEILGNTMHIQVIDAEFGARVTNLYSYRSVSRDVAERWAHPFTPESRLLSQNGADIEYAYGNRYVDSVDSVGLNYSVKGPVVIGKNTYIGEGSLLRNCVIGHNCTIGRDVRVDSCILWNDVVIEDGCRISNTVCCDQVHLYPGTHITSGGDKSSSLLTCLLGNKVKLGPDVKVNVSEDLALMSTPLVDDWGESSDRFEDCGSKGEAFIYMEQSDSESKASMSSASDGDSDADDFDHELQVPDTELFFNELLELMKRVTTEDISHENIILDINSLKHAYNIQIHEVNHMLIESVLEYPIRAGPPSTPQQLLNTIKPLLKKCNLVFKNYYRSSKSQLECLSAIQEYCKDDAHPLHVPNLPQILMFFYQNDILEEEVITSWYKSLADTAVKEEVKKLIDWFEEAEEDDSDSD